MARSELTDEEELVAFDERIGLQDREPIGALALDRLALLSRPVREARIEQRVDVMATDDDAFCVPTLSLQTTSTCNLRPTSGSVTANASSMRSANVICISCRMFSASMSRGNTTRRTPAPPESKTISVITRPNAIDSRTRNTGALCP